MEKLSKIFKSNFSVDLSEIIAIQVNELDLIISTISAVNPIIIKGCAPDYQKLVKSWDTYKQQEKIEALDLYIKTNGKK